MKKIKRVLLIGMNPLSETLNNGKTLASFFREYPPTSLAQLYFSPSLPDSDVCLNYFQISDMDVLRNFLKRQKKCGQRVSFVDKSSDHDVEEDLLAVKKIKKNQTSRLLREFIWGNRWKTKELDEWLDDFKPEVIFFTAADSVFSYKICNYIQKRYTTKLVTYITDDYVLPRRTLSLVWWLRRNYVLKHMRKAVEEADCFITISEYMREVYHSFFGKDSFVAVNMVNSLKEQKYIKEKQGVEMVYLGGLHYNRDKVLKKLANAIEYIQKETKLDVCLRIYSAQLLSERQINFLEVDNVSEFVGKIEGEEVKRVLNEADILVHVESFDKKNIYDTRLSLSTKIPEYLSVGKAILAIGPAEIASMQYLKDVAICINDPKEIKDNVKKIISEKKNVLELYGNKAEKKYIEKHAETKKKEFMQVIEQL